VILAIASPLVLSGRSFGSDWPLHLWLLSREQVNLQDMHFPGLFASAQSPHLIPMGVFFPIFAFTGATLYTIGALISIALGNQPIAAYIVLWVGAFAIAYGGLTWIAHQVGLRGLGAQVPGALYVTGAYYLTDAYARGDLAELVGLSVLPLFVAALCSVLASERVRIRDALALVGATVLLTGSHNITLLWGHGVPRRPRTRRVGRVPTVTVACARLSTAAGDRPGDPRDRCERVVARPQLGVRFSTPSWRERARRAP